VENAVAKLVPVPLVVSEASAPPKIAAFLKDAEERIEAFQDQHQVHGFVPSQFPVIYHALKHIQDESLATGLHFCEWGSGFGVVACLAASLGYTACGIEVNEELVASATQLAGDYDLEVDFHCDSFIPIGGEDYIAMEETSSWLTEQAGTLEEEGILPENYDVIFVYPWPGEESVTERLFRKFANHGALLLSFHGREGLRLQRKVREGTSAKRR
jgi:hypothetical protein